MDGERFDRLAVAWITGSRRRLLRGALAAVLGPARPGDAAAAACPGLGVSTGCFSDGDCAGCSDAVCQLGACRRPPGGKCSRNRQCASGSCNRKKRRCRRCPTGQTACGGRCVPNCSQDISPDICICCYRDACANTGTLCCAGSCVNQQCACRSEGEQCATNRDCCSSVCDRGGKCACTLPGGGCTRGAQCCSGRCDVDGRCAAF